MKSQRIEGKKMVRIRNLLCMVVLCNIILLTVATMCHGESFLSLGSRGKSVINVQSYLQQLNYLRQRPNGYYSRITAEAVKAFQLEHSLKVDGIVGPETMAAFQDAACGRNSVPYLASRGHISGVKALPWSIVNELWRVGEAAAIIDTGTGKSFRVGRLYGYYHADVEPLTKADTETMLEIYGGKWSWDRRAVVVCLGNMFIAASMNGMPHGGKSIAGNGFPGQFCIHFLGSRIHQSGAVDYEHLAMIEQAATYDLNLSKIQARPQQILTPTGIGYSREL